MKLRTITKMLLFVIIIALAGNDVDAAVYVKDHGNCPTSYQSQDCTGANRACGYTGSTLYCSDSSTINGQVPGITGSANITPYNTTLGGGYILDCVKDSTVCTPCSVRAIARVTTIDKKQIVLRAQTRLPAIIVALAAVMQTATATGAMAVRSTCL